MNESKAPYPFILGLQVMEHPLTFLWLYMHKLEFDEPIHTYFDLAEYLQLFDLINYFDIKQISDPSKIDLLSDWVDKLSDYITLDNREEVLKNEQQLIDKIDKVDKVKIYNFNNVIDNIYRGMYDWFTEITKSLNRIPLSYKYPQSRLGFVMRNDTNDEQKLLQRFGYHKQDNDNYTHSGSSYHITRTPDYLLLDVVTPTIQSIPTQSSVIDVPYKPWFEQP